jgi:hypothetical protein
VGVEPPSTRSFRNCQCFAACGVVKVVRCVPREDVVALTALAIARAVFGDGMEEPHGTFLSGHAWLGCCDLVGDHDIATAWLEASVRGIGQ